MVLVSGRNIQSIGDNYVEGTSGEQLMFRWVVGASSLANGLIWKWHNWQNWFESECSGTMAFDVATYRLLFTANPPLVYLDLVAAIW